MKRDHAREITCGAQKWLQKFGFRADLNRVKTLSVP